jgi:hypothetical protein
MKRLLRFERHSYFVADHMARTSDKSVLNRVPKLKDSCDK